MDYLSMLPKRALLAIIDQGREYMRYSYRSVCKRLHRLNPIYLFINPRSLVSRTFQWPKEEWQCDAVILMLERCTEDLKSHFTPQEAQLLVARAIRRNQHYIAFLITHAMGPGFASKYMWGMVPYYGQWMRYTSKGCPNIIQGNTWSDRIQAILFNKKEENDLCLEPGTIISYPPRKEGSTRTKRDKEHTYANFYQRWVEHTAGKTPTALNWVAFVAREHGYFGDPTAHETWCPYGCAEDQEDLFCDPLYHWVHNDSFTYSTSIVPPAWALPLIAASARAGGPSKDSQSKMPLILPVLSSMGIERLLCAALRGGNNYHLAQILDGLELIRDTIKRVPIMNVLFAVADLDVGAMKRCLIVLVLNEQSGGIISLDGESDWDVCPYLRNFADHRLVALVATCKVVMNARQRGHLSLITQKLVLKAFAAGRGHLTGALTVLIVKPIEKTDTTPDSYREIVVTWFLQILFPDGKRHITVSHEAYEGALQLVTGSCQVTPNDRMTIFMAAKRASMHHLLNVGNLSEWCLNPYKWWRYSGRPNKVSKTTDVRLPHEND